MIIYGFLYTSCTFESDARTISLHRTKKGAYQAMRAHRIQAFVNHHEMGLRYGRMYKTDKVDEYTWRGIVPFQILL